MWTNSSVPGVSDAVTHVVGKGDVESTVVGARPVRPDFLNPPDGVVPQGQRERAFDNLEDQERRPGDKRQSRETQEPNAPASVTAHPHPPRRRRQRLR